MSSIAVNLPLGLLGIAGAVRQTLLRDPDPMWHERDGARHHNGQQLGACYEPQHRYSTTDRCTDCRYSGLARAAIAQLHRCVLLDSYWRTRVGALGATVDGTGSGPRRADNKRVPAGVYYDVRCVCGAF